MEEGERNAQEPCAQLVVDQEQEPHHEVHSLRLTGDIPVPVSSWTDSQALQ